MAQVANTVTLSKANQPFLHLFYGALKGNIDHFCVKKGDREKLENQLQKIEDMVKSGVPSDELDELYGILFRDEFQDYVEKHRPKDYNQLEAEYESFKREMNERMQQMNKLISEMVEQLKNMVTDDRSSDAVADALKQIAPGVALDMFCQLNEQLDKDDNWQVQAEKIGTSVIKRMDEKILTINVVNMFGKGANFWDQHKNLTINLDMENKDKK
jgi:DNA repair exonuclease SbcCD ATPase subunit